MSELMKDAPAYGRYGAECLGTFALVFMLGCSAHGDSVAVTLAYGSLFCAIIYGLCPVSGGHFNPAVTLSLRLADGSRISLPDVLGYMLFQILGGVAGAYVYLRTVGKTMLLHPIGLYTDHQVAAVEAIYTAGLCYVFLNVACGARNQHHGFCIGSTVTAAAIAAGPISGCSLNPAVAAGSVFVAWSLHGSEAAHHLYLYLCAPVIGALLGLILFFAAGGGSLPGIGPDAGRQARAKALESDDEESPLLAGHSPRAASESRRRLSTAPPMSERRLLTHRSDLSESGGSLRVVRHAPFQVPGHFIGHDLFFACRWRMRPARRDEPVTISDIDLSCVKMSITGEHLGGVYFAQGKDVDNGISHSGDEVIGGGHHTSDQECIRFKLSGIQPNVFALIFFVGVWDQDQKFGDITELCARLVDSSRGDLEICRYEKNDFLAQANALIAAMLYRDPGGGWVFYAVDESYALAERSSYRKLLPEMKALTLRVQRPYAEQQSPPQSP